MSTVRAGERSAGAAGVGPLWRRIIALFRPYRVMRDLRERLFGHLERMSLAFFTGTRTGELQSRLANDVGGVQTTITETASSVVSNVVVVGSTIVAC